MNKKALGLAGLGAVALVGGSLAYFSQTSTLENPFTTGSYKTDLHEDYTPPTEDLTPGAKWEKKVGATNTGDYPVLVRIKMDEKWTRKGVTDPYKTLNSTQPKFTGGSYDEATGKFDAEQVSDTDGLAPEEDNTTVWKVMNNTTDDANMVGWIDGGDGYWYWTRVLEGNNDEGTNPGSETAPLMDSLVLASNIDLGKYNKKDYYQIQKNEEGAEADSNAWLELKLVETENDRYYVIPVKQQNGNITEEVVGDENKDGKLDLIDIAKALNVDEAQQKVFWKSESQLDATLKGYAESNYTLGITAEFVQATTDAVADAWKSVPDITKLLTGIEKNADDATLVNK